MSERFDVVVVGRAQETAAVAAGVAGVLAARSSLRTALVVTTGGRRGGAAAPPVAPARRLRERLSARALDAWACGRIVWCAVGGVDPAADACRAAAVDGPVVLAVCGARAPWVEPLLEQAALVVVAGDEAEPLSALALAALHARGLPAVAVAAPDGLGAALARIGLGAPAAWRAALPVAVGARA